MKQELAAVAVDYRYVQSDAELEQVCRQWRNCEALALDTEFVRVSTFYPRAGLFQVSDGSEVVLIDPLPISDWSCFRELLTDDNCVKLLHSCSEDLLVFLKQLDVIPTPIFDTQIASSMLEHGLSASYQALVSHYCGVDLPKGETRSDWLQRPLTEQQLDYAALDVAYLHQIWRIQREQLERLDRMSWMEEECSRLEALYADEITQDFSGYYRNFKAAWQMKPQQLACLLSLAAWRERRARERDKPRSWIIRDPALFSIAQTLPASRAQLAVLDEVSDNFLRYEGDRILELVKEAAALPADLCPPPLPKPFSQSQKNRLKKAKQLVEAKAEELGISPEFLGRKRTLHALLYALVNGQDAQEGAAGCVPAELQGWRKAVLLDDLLKVMQS